MTTFTPLIRRAAGLAAVFALVATATQTGTTDAAPTARPKGRIAVVIGGGLTLVSPATASKRELATGVMSSAAWSPDGRELAYVAGSPSGEWLSAMSTVTKRARPLTRIRGISLGPKWSPRGDRLAFTLDGVGAGSQLVVVDRDGRKRRVVERQASSYQVPQWSPDGRLIAYLKDAPGGVQSLWTARPNGRGRRVVQRTVLGYPDSVAWSPDGRRIAFVGAPPRTEGATAIVIARADGGSARTVSSVAASESEASVGNVSWSPRGGAIAYIRWTLDQYGDRVSSELCVADPQGRGTRVLARSQFIDELTWSPDGEWLAYLTDERTDGGAGSMRIWLVRRDGTGKRPLTQMGDEASGLSWSPR